MDESHAHDTAEDHRDALSAFAAPETTPPPLDTPVPENGPCAGAGEGGRGIPTPPKELAAPPACPCSSPLPCPSPLFRRGVCRTAYRKLSESGLPIGDDRRDQANASRGIAQLAHRLSQSTPETMDALAQRMKPDGRERMLRAIEKARGR